ncbi:MAG: putative porin, partial [Bacteroidales bacterium]|nr:putative porin [Bacteroidales bacterium]
FILYLMKHLLIYIIFMLSLLSAEMAAQIVDTTKEINTWKLMHNYTRFEDTKMDTALHDLHLNFNPLNRNGIAYEHLGILGHAAQNIYLFDRPGMSHFLFGASIEPYLATPDRTVFYNTRTPYTELVYSNMFGVDWNEESVRFLHTQNMDPFTNIGIDFEILSGKEMYINEESRVSKVTLFGSRAKQKYSAFGTFHFNRFGNRENGGLKNPESFLADSLSDKWLYPVKLNNAQSGYTRMQFFYTQKFMISEKLSRTDEDIKDSAVFDKVSNTLQFVLGDPYTDLLSARVYAGHEFSRYGQVSPEEYQVFSHFDTMSYSPLVLDSVYKDTATGVMNNRFFNELFVGFHVAGPPNNPWYWNVDGKYYLAGYYRNNFVANATFSRQVFKTYRLGLRGNIENRNVSYYHNNYSSSFFSWKNDFKASQLIRGEAFLTNTEKRFEAILSAGVWTNFLYWDENALPAQYDKTAYIISGKFNKHFKVSGFNSHNHLLVQYTTAEEVLRLPLLALKTSNYWEQVFFKGALTAQIGIDIYITTPYKGSAYMPATGVFYLQNSRTLGGYPFADAFLGIQIKRTRIFVSYNNGLAGIAGNNYFTASEYPTKPAFFRFGLAWTFYD